MGHIPPFLESEHVTPDRQRTGRTAGSGIPHNTVNSSNQLEAKLQVSALSVLKLMGSRRRGVLH